MNMAKRILAAVMLVLVLVSCVAITATATTKNKVGTKVGTWKYDCSVWSGTYYSKYNDDTTWNHRIHPVQYVMSQKDHASWVRNNKTGATSGWVYAECGEYSNARVKASWTGSGSASWYLK